MRPQKPKGYPLRNLSKITQTSKRFSRQSNKHKGRQDSGKIRTTGCKRKPEKVKSEEPENVARGSRENNREERLGFRGRMGLIYRKLKESSRNSREQGSQSIK